MAKKITKDEVYESDLLIPLIKQGKELEKILLANSKALGEFAKQQANIAKNSDTTSAKGIKNLEKATKSLSAAQKEKQRIDKEAVTLKAKLNTANSESIQKNAELKVQLAEQKKVNKQLAREKLKMIGAYEKEAKKLVELRKKWKDLAIQNKQNTKEGRALLKQINKLDDKLKSVDASVGQFQRNVGNYTQGFKRLGSIWKQLTNVVTQFGIALGGVAIARNAFNVIKDFDQALANLKAISGATTQEMELLSKQAKELGSTTSFTASQVAGLQTELAKLGFNPTEIEQSTESILLFAKATGADLSEAASLTGSALRAFGLDAEDSGRVASVLGVATTKTALDFGKLNTALSTVAPVANSFGFSIEETTALLGQLSNAGFDASSAATSTRNILLNLADANGKLAKKLGRPVKSAKDLSAGLLELKSQGVDLAEALELTDKRSVAAFQTFLEGADGLDDLVDGLTDVEDELENIAEIQDDTLQGSISRLQSAWEGYILSLNEAGGAGESLKQFIDFLAENLPAILNTLLKVIKVFTIWKTTVVAMNKVILPLRENILKMATNMSAASKSTDAASVSFKNFNKAMAANVIAVVVVALVELIDKLNLFESEVDRINAKIESFNSELDANDAAAQKGINNRIKGLKKLLKEKQKDAQTDEERLAITQKFITAQNIALAGLELSYSNSTRQIDKFQTQIEGLNKFIQNSNDTVKKNEAQYRLDNLKALRDEEVIKRSATEIEIEAIKAFKEELKVKEKTLDVDKKSLKVAGQKAQKEITFLQKLKNELKAVRFEQEKLVEIRDGEEFILDEEEFKRNQARILQLKDDIKDIEIELEEFEFKKLDKIELEGGIENEQGFIGGEVVEKTKEEAKEVENTYKELANAIAGLFESITEIIEKQLDKQIDKQNEIIKASRKRQSFLEQQAAEGNQLAKDSLAAEEAREAEALKKKQIAERRKRQLESANIILESIANLVGQGKSIGEATGISVASFEAVKQLLSNLPAFYEGTENTGKGGKVDNKGGFLSVLHPEERVMTASQNDMVGDMSNWELAKLASDFHNGTLTPQIQSSSVINAMSNKAIISELKEVKEAINNKPTHNIELSRIMEAFMEITETKIKGNKKEKTIHRFRK
jgi:TP901 family phage tail tape measure protein